MSSPRLNKGNDMKRILQPLAGVALLASAGPGFAIDFSMGEVSVLLNSKASLGAAMRLQQRDPELIGIANGGTAYSTNIDDGDLAWGRGKVVSGVAKITSDLSVNYGDFGLFVRGSAFGNPVVQNHELFNPANYGANREAPQSERIAKDKMVHDALGFDADLLDAYAFARFSLGERSLLIKAGRQVLNWGESVFVQHGVNALITADVNQLRIPGWDIEEVQIPVGMALVSVDVMKDVGLEAFYQYEWQQTRIDGSGTFWSTNDIAGVGGTRANLGNGRAYENQQANALSGPCTDGTACVAFGSTVPRAPDREASANGQYGGKLSFYVPALNNMDLSVYMARYNSRLPLVSGTSRLDANAAATTANYFLEYPENLKLYGMSFNTTVAFLDVAVQGEYSYKVDQPLQIDDVEVLLAGLGALGQINTTSLGGTLFNQYLRGYRRKDVSQIDLSVTKIIGPHLGWDQLSMFVETGYVRVHDMEHPSVLAYDAPGTYTFNPGSAALNPSSAAGLPITPYSAYATPESWGYKFAGRFSYNNVFNLVTLEPTLVFQHDVKGITPGPIVNFVHGRKQVNAILGINYLQAWNVDLGYTTYFDGGYQNLSADRDTVDVSIKYSF
jgi:hypothetical protein